MKSLRKNELFQEVYKNGKSFGNKNLVVYVLRNNQGFNRLGISVSKKVGNSIVRHRLTRLIRESCRLHEDMFNSSLDIVVIARVNANTVKKCAEIEKSFIHAAKHLNIIKEA